MLSSDEVYDFVVFVPSASWIVKRAQNKPIAYGVIGGLESKVSILYMANFDDF